MKIDFLENEYWYGGIVHKGIKMPISKNDNISMNLITAEDVCDQYSPLFISNKGRYIHSEKPFVITFDNGVITVKSVDEVKLYSGYENLKGAQLAAAKNHFSLEGKIPNEEFFKVPQYNTWIELVYNQNEKQILEYAKSFIDAGMQPGILMIDEGWAPDYGDYDFCKRKFDNPKKMVDELHKMGFKVMLWVTAHISPDSDCFRELRNTDYLIKDKDGEFAIRKWWNGYSCILDLTNPNACKWFKEKLDNLMEKYGVDGFKFDAGGTYLYREDDQTFIKQIPSEHTKAFDEFCSQYEYNELRCVWNSGGKPLVCRLMDKNPLWDDTGIEMLMPNMLLQGLLGYYFGCPDMIGGGAYSFFDKDRFVFDEELYLRWLQISVLCPMMQFSISPKRLLSENGFETAQKITKLHSDYSDKIIKLAHNASLNGEPILRYMEYEFPNQGFEKVTDQFMLGSDLLVAPVVKKGKVTKNVILPKGRWQDIYGNIYDGGCTLIQDAPVDKLIYFIKID